MFYRTYLDKDNTIYKDDYVNVGQNEIGELYFNSEKGCNIYSRHLIHFPIEHLKEKYLNCELGDLTNVRHILKLYPASPPCDRQIGKDVDILIYKLCQDFEEGCGYDLNTSKCGIKTNDAVYSIAPSNWFESSYCVDWCENGTISYTGMQVTIDESCVPSECVPQFEELCYQDIPLSTHLSANTIELSSVTQTITGTTIVNNNCLIKIDNEYSEKIIVSQTEGCNLDFRTVCIEVPITGSTDIITGSTINSIVNSDLDYYAEYHLSATSEIVDSYHINCSNYCGLQFDLTDCINEMITGDTGNLGFGISLHPKHELYSKGEWSIPFYNRNTLTFFKPHIDTICETKLEDNRLNFDIDCPQKLYLQTKKSLDENPIVKIYDGNNCLCLSAQTVCCGDCLYEASIEITGGTECQIFKDVWTNIIVNGKSKSDVIGRFSVEEDDIVGGRKQLGDYGINVNGIKKNESISACEIRRVCINLREPLSLCPTDKFRPDKVEYRVYVKEGLSDWDVICWTEANYIDCQYYFDLDTTWMLPTYYYIDVKVTSGKQVKTNCEVLEFAIVGKANLCGC